MKWNGWEKSPLAIPDHKSPTETHTVDAITPVIVSVSRSTDIPAFYGDWFMARLHAGWVKWNSPFGGKPVYVSFAKTRVFVFWSKNPGPFLRHLDTLDRLGYHYYFLFTLNDYDKEGLEPRVPPLGDRVATFIRLSQRIGREQVIWRFDPLVLSDQITVSVLLQKIKSIGDRIAPFTSRMIFSFVDIQKYGNVKRNLKDSGFADIREFTDTEVDEFCVGLAALNKTWGFAITACSERRDLSQYGIGQGQCIRYDLMVQEFSDDNALMQFLHPNDQRTLFDSPTTAESSRLLKDPGQRTTCHCIVSKDIGQYSTCPHLCAYCYANSSAGGVQRTYARYCEARDRGVFPETITQ